MCLANLFGRQGRSRTGTKSPARRRARGFERLEPRLALAADAVVGVEAIAAANTTDDTGAALFEGWWGICHRDASQTNCLDGGVRTVDDRGPVRPPPPGPPVMPDERPIIEYILGSTDEFETVPGGQDPKLAQENAATRDGGNGIIWYAAMTDPEAHPVPGGLKTAGADDRVVPVSDTASAPGVKVMALRVGTPDGDAPRRFFWLK